MRAPQTWHHGLIADWWANFNLAAPEVELYRPYLRSPVLDAGCGAGRLLVPLLAAGYDIDGCDVSADMIHRCRKRAPGATLWVSPLHELVPPRRYGSIVASGVFGLGSTRAQDEEAVRRLHDALEPCGTLILDNEESPWHWRPRDWSHEPERKTTLDGVEFALWSRVDAVDEHDRCVHMTIRAQTSDGRREEHELTMRQWYRDELVPLLERTGFAAVDVNAGADERTLVYVASRHGDHEALPR
jgi:SAM-dependent methyltransferase